jgi:hypothetical protein
MSHAYSILIQLSEVMRHATNLDSVRCVEAIGYNFLNQNLPWCGISYQVTATVLGTLVVDDSPAPM